MRLSVRAISRILSIVSLIPVVRANSQQVYPPYSQDSTIVVRVPALIGHNATLTAYDSCSLGAKPLSAPGGTNVPGGGATPQYVGVTLINPLHAGDIVCVVEVFTGGAAPVPTSIIYGPVKTSDAPASKSGKSSKHGASAQRDSIPWGVSMAGVDVAGASSTDAKAVFLGAGMMDFDVNGDGPTQADWGSSITGLIRIAGMAQPGTLSGNLGTLSAATTYLSAADNATPDKVVQSIEGTLGVGLQAYHHDVAYNAVITESFIASVGAITPLSVDQTNPPVYLLTNQILQQFSGQIQGNNPSSCAYTTTAPTCYVAFIPEDRTHFYRHYEAGVRLKLYENAGVNTYTFPANADLTIGQNEYVTRGKLSGIVLHFGGMIPLPKYPWVYGFGSMDTSLSGESLQNDAEQLILSPAPSSANLTYLSPSVYTIPVGQPRRDRYMLGFGIDIYHLVKAK